MRYCFWVKIGVLSAVFLACGFLLYGNLSARDEFNTDITTLVQMIATPEPTETPTAQAAPDSPEPGDILLHKNRLRSFAQKEENNLTEADALPDYSALYEKNPDFSGWLVIDGTIVNYPVMQTPSDPYYYLRRDFDKNHSRYGLPFVAADCDLKKQTDNILIYGHNMKDGSVFGALMPYKDPLFCEQNPSIQFDTLDENGKYQIWAVFLTTTAEGGFPFYRYIDFEKPEAFNAFVNAVKDMALYCTDVTPDYHARQLTLSTCDSSITDGRLVIVAQQQTLGQ